MANRVIVAAFILLIFSGAVNAQQPAAPLNAERANPFLWRVVFQVKEHPLLDVNFRAHLRRDLTASLQPSLKAICTVDVIDMSGTPTEQWDPLWRLWAEKGFNALNGPINADLTGVKTHFLRVEYRDGVYFLESRQYDGFAGLASPVVRTMAIRAPELVGRAAGIMIDRDFGSAGTIEPGSKPDEVRLVLRGGNLISTDKLATAGDVFAIAQIRQTNRPAPPPVRTATGKIINPSPDSTPPPGYTAAVRDYTLLRVLDVAADGTCRCQVFTRLKEPFKKDAAIAGYRCLKLATITAPVNVRILGLDGKAIEQGSSLSVRATDRGFNTAPDPHDNLDFRDGLYRSSSLVSNIACITVAAGPTGAERFAVPVLGPEPIALRFELNPKKEELAAFERACQALWGQTADARQAHAACFDAVSRHIARKQNSDAHNRAENGFASAEDAIKTIGEDLIRLRRDAESNPDKMRSGGDLLGQIDVQIRALRTSNAQLATRVKDLKGILAKENDGTSTARDITVESLSKEIASLLARGEVEQALNIYDQLVTLLPENAEVVARRDKLKADWAPKNAEHAKARDFLFTTWPALTTVADFKDNLRLLRTAADTCIRAGDRYGCRRVQAIFTGTAAKLEELTKSLDSAVDADRKAATDAKEIREVVAKIEQDVLEFVRKAEQDKGP